MKHDMSYNQIKAIDKAEELKNDNRIGILAAVVLFGLYCMASTMEFNDCLKGIC